MALVYPLIAWGGAEDISASPWVDAGTPTVTGGQADPLGGTSAYLIEDNDAGVHEGRYLPLAVTQDGTHMAVACVKAGTATSSAVEWTDATDVVSRVMIKLTWSGGVPTATVDSGNGSVLTAVAIGASFYAIVFTVEGVVAANLNRLYMRAAGVTSPTTGTTTFYVRNLVLLPPLDNATAFDDPRDGYEQVQAPSGEEDAWTVATDYQLSGDIRYVSKLPVDSPLTYSGWDGLNEASGVDCGVGAMLRAGRDKADLVYCPDRSDCTDNTTSKLKDPLQGGVGQEDDGTRRVRITLRNGTTEYAGYV